MDRSSPARAALVTLLMLPVPDLVIAAESRIETTATTLSRTTGEMESSRGSLTEEKSDRQSALASREGPNAIFPRDGLYPAAVEGVDLRAEIEYQRSEDTLNDHAYALVENDRLPGLLGWWTLWNQPFNRQPFDWQTHCNGAAGIDTGGAVLNCWLSMHAKVREAMIWQDVDMYGNVTEQDYDQWSAFMKDYLAVMFHHYTLWLESSATQFPAPPLPDPPANQKTLQDGQAPVTALQKIQAQVLYLQNVAHSLAVEIGGFVPWSLLHYYDDELEMLLASESMFNAGEYASTHVNNPVPVTFTGYWPREVTPSPPTTTFAFLVEENLVRPSHYDTIARLLKWGRENMYHYHGGSVVENMENHWHYRGHPPVERMIEGTLRQDPAASKLQSWARGCHGTSFFFREVLRSVNIPVKPVWLPVTPNGGGHRSPVFTTIDRMLSHGDDVYGVRFNIPSVDPDYIEPDRLLIDHTKLLYWFNLSGNPDAGKNVGRQVYEIALDVLPDKLMELYCEDLAKGMSHGQGEVYATFDSFYTVSELEAMSLWQRLATKNATYGYCPTYFQFTDKWPLSISLEP